MIPAIAIVLFAIVVLVVLFFDFSKTRRDISHIRSATSRQRDAAARRVPSLVLLNLLRMKSPKTSSTLRVWLGRSPRRKSLSSNSKPLAMRVFGQLKRSTTEKLRENGKGFVGKLLSTGFGSQHN